MPCFHTKGAGTLAQTEESGEELFIGEGYGTPFGWWWTELYDGLDDLRGHLIGAQLGLRVQAGTGGFAPVFGLEVAHSVLHVRDTVAGGWGLNWYPSYGDNGFTTNGLYNPFWTNWQGIFTLDQLTTGTFTMGFGTPNVLFYGEFGVAIGRASYSTTTGFNGTGTGFGPVFGGGVEVRIGPRLSVFSEFNRVRLNDIQMIGTHSAFGHDNLPMLVDVNVVANIIKVGFNIQLGGN